MAVESQTSERVEALSCAWASPVIGGLPWLDLLL
jgi:hypothetical protein